MMVEPMIVEHMGGEPPTGNQSSTANIRARRNENRFVHGADLVGIFVVFGFYFLRKPEPPFCHRQQDRLRNGVVGVLGHAQAFGCVASMILGSRHYTSLGATASMRSPNNLFPRNQSDRGQRVN
jgi:hypothetical protein